MTKATLLLLASLAFAACAESRYRSNVQNAPVTRWTHLSRADYEQVVRLVSESTHQPIIGITTDGVKRDPTHLHVITGFSDSDIQRWTGFHVEKRPNGWHITARGDIAVSRANDIIRPTMRSDHDHAATALSDASGRCIRRWGRNDGKL